MRSVLRVSFLTTLVYLSRASSHTSSPAQHPFHESGRQHWSLQEADERTCDACTQHFTGQVEVARGRGLFFWFFKSRDKSDVKPTVVWLNGGPGASSMVGLFTGIGPCILDDNNSTTSRNENSWIKYANMIFLDQPAAVGFSAVDNPALSPSGLATASSDFASFLDTFFEFIFPDLAGQRLIFAGESFAGNYVSYFANDIIKRQQLRSSAFSVQGRPQHRLSGIVLINALVSFKYLHSAHYDMFCTPGDNLVQFNQSTCNAMAKAIPKCEKLHTVCELLLVPEACQAAVNYCEDNVGKYFAEEVWSGRHSPYDLRQPCPHPPICGGGKYSGGSVDGFLNRRDIQSSLGFAVPVFYQSLNLDVNSRWMSRPEIFLPRTLDLANLLDEADLQVLVLNGNLDVSINTVAVLRQYDELPWHGQAEYRATKLQNWYWKNERGQLVKGGEFKQTNSKSLSLFTVDNAGHMSPAAQPRAVTSVFEQWVHHALH